MIQIPDNFPSYTAYNAKQLLQQVDTLKAAIKELQEQVNALIANDSQFTERIHRLESGTAKPAKKAE